MLCVGTRADAIKMCPLYRALTRCGWAEPILLNTAQHAQLCADVLRSFDISADVTLSVMRRGQTPDEVCERVCESASAEMKKHAPAAALVHGDTATALGCAIAAERLGIPVAHVEAGLRTGDERDPFPEEIYRKRISKIAALHLAPTSAARENLLREGIDEGNIYLVGNTVTDAVDLALTMREKAAREIMQMVCEHRTVLFTMHRRESLEERDGECAATRIFRAIDRLLGENPDMHVLFPIHKNERVRDLFAQANIQSPRLHVCEPLDYPTLIYTLCHSVFIMTDSGGLCEEAAYLGAPALILREHTERGESIDAGCAILTTTDEERIAAIATRLWRDDAERAALSHSTASYGTGGVSEKITAVLRNRLKNSALQSEI